MNYLRGILVVSILSLLSLMGCNDPTEIGSELFEQDQASVIFTDALTIEARSIREDSVKTFDPDVFGQLSSFVCGNFMDPVFGPVSADIYAQPRLSTVAPPDANNMLVFDSLILALAYDSTNFYGNIDETFSLDVRRITEKLDNDLIYFSNQSFSSGDVVGQIDFTPNFTDSLKVIQYGTSSSEEVTLSPHLRIRLDDVLGEELLNLDSSAYTTSENFIEEFNGFHLEPTSENSGILNFSLASTLSRMTLYYTEFTDTDTTSREYTFVISGASVKLVNLSDRDYSGTILETAFDTNSTLGDSLLFLQGMNGPNVEINFPDLTDLNSVVINKAELEFVINSNLSGDESVYPPVVQLVAAETDEDEQLISIEDVIVSISRQDIELFGGRVTDAEGPNGEPIQKYTMNVSTHFQKIVDGLVDPKVFLRVSSKPERASRVILYGPQHSIFPTKLNLTYTKL